MDALEMLKEKNWAVIGASIDKSKFSYKIPKILKEKGYKVYLINPKYDEIEGQKVYNNLKEVPGKIDAIDMIVNPKFAKGYLEEAKQLGIKNIFFQPGSFDKSLEKILEDSNFNVVNDCVFRRLNK